MVCRSMDTQAGRLVVLVNALKVYENLACRSLSYLKGTLSHELHPSIARELISFRWDKVGLTLDRSH